MQDEEYDDSDVEELYRNRVNERYDGERNADEERHGPGKAVLHNGDKYDGNYKNGKRHGFGTYYFSRNKARYDGEYQNGQRCGKGSMIFPDGSTYNGQWDNNKRNGEGIYMYLNGDTYDGEWKNGQKHGQGTYVYANHKIMYKGEWQHDRFEGEGQLLTDNYVFCGSFTDQQPSGPGYFKFDKCEQKGQYLAKKTFQRSEKVFQDFEEISVPVWICTALRHALIVATRDKNILL